MVHRSPDSRLLAALLTSEQGYSKALISLLSSSQSSISSFSAYASASTPPTSQVILAVAGSLAGAEEALRKYSQAVHAWMEQLESLKKMEEELTNVIRDREILVTRLIKASKSRKTTRDSHLLSSYPQAHLPSTSSLSLSSSSTKLVHAEAELQACEAHLAALERSVEQRRMTVVKEGLSIRCHAMVECGWVWGEMGKEGLRALDAMDSEDAEVSHSLSSFTHQLTPPSSTSHHSPSSSRPLPRPSSRDDEVHPRPSSEHSLSSQASSNICLPAAHKIDDIMFPTSSAEQFPLHTSLLTPTRHILSHRISEITEPPSEDSEEEARGELVVVQNDRFAGLAPKNDDRTASGKRLRKLSLRGVSENGDISPYVRERKRSFSGGGIFGSIRGLFKGHRKDADVNYDGSDSDTGAWAPGSLIDTPTPSPASRRADFRALSSPSRIRKSVRNEQSGDGQIESDPGVTRIKRVNKQSKTDHDNLRDGSPSQLKKEKSLRKRAQVLSTAHVSPKVHDHGFSASHLPQRQSLSPPSTSKRDLQVKPDTNSSVDIPSVPSASIDPSTSKPGRSASMRSSTSMKSSTSSSGKHRRHRSLPANAIYNGTALGEESISLMRVVDDIDKTPGRTSVDTRAQPHESITVIQASLPLVQRTPPRTRSDIDGLPFVLSSQSESSPQAPRPSDGERARKANSHIYPFESTERRASLSPHSSLRSSLKGSRTPSPAARGVSNGNGKEIVSSEARRPVSGLSVVQFAEDENDSASISSYETGRETFDEDANVDETLLSAPPDVNPPSGSQVSGVEAHETVAHHFAPSADSPARQRKKVRVSLQPQFSPAPPAFEEDLEEFGAEINARRENGTEGVGQRDIWEDSSDEDEEYIRARRLLQKVSKRARI